MTEPFHAEHRLTARLGRGRLVRGTGLLPEQIDRVTGEPVLVVPLTWSHAMYVLLALKPYG